MKSANMDTENGMYYSIEMYTKFWWEMEKDHLKDLGIDGRIILRCIIKNCYGRAWTGLIWLGIGRNGGCL